MRLTIFRWCTSKLREYAENLRADNVGAVALFTTSNWSRRTVRALKKILKTKGIKVYDDFLYVHMLKVNSAEDKAIKFADKILEKFNKENK